MEGNQVADGQSPQKLLIADMIFPGICNHGKRNGHTLIPAAGVDDNRKRTAAHSGIRAGSRRSPGADSYAAGAVSVQESPAHLDSPGIFKPFLGDCRVAGDLAGEDRADGFKLHRCGIVQDISDVQKRFVRKQGLSRGGSAVLLWRCKEGAAVFCDFCNIAVKISDFYLGPVTAFAGGDDNVQVFHPLDQLAPAETRGGQAFRLFNLFGRHILQNSQNLFRISSHNAKNSGSIDALHSAGIGNRDALHIFNNISAACCHAAIRHGSQDFPNRCARIGDGDRLCTAQSRNKLCI